MTQVTFRQCSHYAGEISSKRSSVSTSLKFRQCSTGWPTVHANLSRKPSFVNTLFKPEEYEDAGFAF